MTQSRAHVGLIGWARCAVILTVVLAVAGPAGAQVPQVGEVQTLKVITISMQVGSTEKETKQVTYTPPPGWYVRSHWVDCTAKHGNSSFAVTTVPRDWSWLSEEKVTESYKVLIDLAGRCSDAGLQAKFALERDTLLRQLREVHSTHHALVVDATARGEGFLRSSGCLELTVTAELVYVGTAENLRRTTAQRGTRLR
jgi:hypothetical protein